MCTPYNQCRFVDSKGRGTLLGFNLENIFKNKHLKGGEDKIKLSRL